MPNSYYYTSHNQRLQSAGDNDRRSKHFCSCTVFCTSFMWQMVKNARDQISSNRRSERAWSKCVLCIPYILSGSPNECWHAKKVASDSPGLVDFAIRLVVFVLNLPDGKCCFLGNSNYRRIVINPANQKGCGASWNDLWATC